MTAIILPKLGHCRNIDEAVESLQRMGARLIGKGFFATAFRLEVVEQPTCNNVLDQVYADRMQAAFGHCPDRSVVRCQRVIKVSGGDKGGLAAAQAAMMTKDYDDLAPRYYGIIDLGGGNWIGEMELLSPAEKGYEGIGHGPKTAHLTGGGRSPDPTVLNGSPYLRACEVALEAVGAFWDIHTDNIMMRGDQPVISDPLARC